MFSRAPQADETGEIVLWVLTGLIAALTLLTSCYVCATSKGTRTFFIDDKGQTVEVNTAPSFLRE